MENITIKNMLSMAELQKLSLKKLRKRSTPLFVVDRKSKKKGFVILDYETYERTGTGASDLGKKIQKTGKLLNAYDFKAAGLFWDRPEMTNKKFVQCLIGANHPQRAWAVSRFFERLPSQTILKLLSLSTIETLLKKARLREPVQKSWNHALNYWNQKTPSGG